jgi:DNA primase
VRFSQDFIDKVLQATDIVQVISPYTELKPKGDRFWGRCPFPDHKEKTPSFSVSQGQQFFYCFGCKKGGNAFHFMQTYNGMSFPESVEQLARKAAIALPEGETPQRVAQRESKDLLTRINKLAAVTFHHALKELPADHPVQMYVQGRGLTPEIIERFRLGTTFSEWQALCDLFKSKGVPLEAAESLGLIKKRKTGTDVFDIFRERIMFPIFSPSGDVLGFGGRTYTDGTPKYYNSPETPLFHKGRVLYGLHETAKFIRSQDHAIVVEGYMDALALYAAGIQNVVAILGTAFTPEHAKLLKRYTSKVTMLLDGDDAGVNAAERSLPILLAADLRVKGCFLPGGLDPDDFVKTKGVEALQAEIDGSRELFSLVLSRWMQGYRGSASEKVDLVTKCADVLRSALSRQLVALYIDEIAQRLDVETTWVVQMLRETDANRPVVAERPADVSSEPVREDLADVPLEVAPIMIKVTGAPKDELELMALALRSLEIFEELHEQKAFEMFSHPGLRKLAALALERYGQKPGDFAKLGASLASQIDAPGLLFRSEASSATDDTEERRLMTDYLNAIRRRDLKNQGKTLSNQFRDQADPEEREKALEQFMNIQRNRLSINREGRE